jgi:hypothetical protein
MIITDAQMYLFMLIGGLVGLINPRAFFGITAVNGLMFLVLNWMTR